MKHIPVLLEQCQHIWQLMEQEAEVQEGGAKIWSGALVHLFERAGYGQPNYTRITKALQQMDSIFQVERGGGQKDSVWEIRREPTEKLFDERDRDAPTTERDPLEQKVNDLASKVPNFENRLEALEKNQRRVLAQLEKVSTNATY